MELGMYLYFSIHLSQWDEFLINVWEGCKDLYYIYRTMLVTFITHSHYLIMFPFLCLGLCLADISLHLTYLPCLHCPTASFLYIASPIYLDLIVQLQAL